MGAFKSLTSQDLIVSPLVVSGESTNATVDIILGKNTTYNSINDESNPSPWPSASLVYASIKQLYYSNTFPNNLEPYIIINNQGNVIEGSQTANVNSRYDNYLQSGLYAPRYFPTGSNNIIAVINIPQSLFGDYIKPGSFFLVTSGFYYDDKQGNIYSTSNGNYVGNIIYTHGIIIITNQSLAASLTLINTANIIYQSARTVYETQYKCTIRPDEFNYSLNPTLLSGSTYTNPINSNGQPVNTSGDVIDFVTGSAFAPYITAVGLYNTNNELLAIGKLAQPIPTSRTVDMNIVINMDK